MIFIFKLFKQQPICLPALSLSQTLLITQTQLLAFHINTSVSSHLCYRSDLIKHQLFTAQYFPLNGFPQLLCIGPPLTRPWKAYKDSKCCCCLGIKMWGYFSRSQSLCWLCKTFTVKSVLHGLCLFATKLICFLCTSLASLALANTCLLHHSFLSLQVSVVEDKKTLWSLLRKRNVIDDQNEKINELFALLSWNSVSWQL